MIKKTDEKVLWGNGVGTGSVVWFNRPRKYKYISKTDLYVPVGDKACGRDDGGFWIGEEGIHSNSGCVTILSQNRNEVSQFTKIATRYGHQCGCFMASNAIRTIKRHMNVKL